MDGGCGGEVKAVFKLYGATLAGIFATASFLQQKAAYSYITTAFPGAPKLC